ncbi:hypothetical protein PSQ19_01660 [Devosia algicola]|uniref:Uncharacterized protein n=1 Tax=Devosia algicola TaxID=3026418 RepID=A0ABY7YNW5_9HYPH|nr:hypothetical protein [Devosia algicola]WDR02956.1 hypothetical protein PSQ19_01660 [Devosia algicola]
MDSVTVAFELMRMELDAEVENLNTEGAKFFRASMYTEAEDLTKKGNALQAFLDKVRTLEMEWTHSFAATEVAEPADQAIEKAARKILSSSKSSKTALLVRFPNGNVLAKEKAADTLIAVIQHAGMERVANIGLMVNGENIVSRSPSKKYNEAPVPPYFVKTHSSTAQKKRNIEQISDELNLGLMVEII